jgi:hypothetical protein
MKLSLKYWAPLFSLILAFTACKEENPGVILEKPPVNFTDSTYIAAQPETPQQKGVLVEDFTGMRCKNCPKGHRAIEALRKKFPGRVSALGIHSFEYQGFTTPLNGGEDMRVKYGAQILDIVGRPTGLPYGTVDRVLKSGNSGVWETFTTDRLNKTTPVNLYIEHEYDEGSRNLKVKVRAVFTDSLGTTPFFSVAIAESGIISPQQDLASTKPDNIEPEYVHDHVLREMPAFKQTLLPQGINLPVANRVVEKSFTLELKPEWKAENCEIVFFVHREEEVLHVIETKVK